MHKFEDLDVWRKAHGIVLKIYGVSAKIPPSENFGLILNLRRSAVSMASRIAEGAGKSSDVDFAVDLKRSRATAYELEYLLLVARDLGFIEAEVYDEVVAEVVEVRKMASGLLRRFNSDS